jgi:transcription initiation factor TFIIIB Brf1 subunit/transcription initiation factor TFIIB
MPYCPECGGDLFYDPRVKRYVCKSCGLSLTFQEISEIRDEIRPDLNDEDKRKQRKKDYLSWWFSKKE